jgi:hypothetical protein
LAAALRVLRSRDVVAFDREVAEAKRAAANRAKAARAGGKHLELNPYHERRAEREAVAAAHAARRASTKEPRRRAWELQQEQEDDYFLADDADTGFSWGEGSGGWEG